MLNFYAPINNLGYGIHSYNFIKALEDEGVEICLFPIHGKVSTPNIDTDRWIANQSKFNKDDTSIMIFHENEMNRFYGKKRIGFPVFETGIRKEDIPLLESLDYIFQPSHWGKEYLEKLGFKNVYVVPEGYSDKVFNTMISCNFKEKLNILDKHGIIFTHIGKFEYRKSSEDILTVFTQALEGENVKCKLFAHMFNPFMLQWLDIVEKHLFDLGYSILQKESNLIKYSKANLTVLVLKTGLKSIVDFYRQSHFGLYASKAEGFNLPLIESLACGLPCITTNWTGQSEYLKDYPKELIIEKGEEEIANDGVWFFGSKGTWIKPDLSSLKNILQKIVKDPVTYLNLYKQCNDCVKDFTWKNSVLKAIAIMKELNILT